MPMMPSMSATGTGSVFDLRPVMRNSMLAWSSAVSAPPGPPMGSILLASSGLATQSAMKAARSRSEMGLQAARVPSPKKT